MAFCTNCGANVQGAFCPSCGTPAPGAPAAQPAPQAPPPAYQQPYAPAGAPVATRGKKGPLFWILMVVLGLIAIGGLAAVAIGVFVVQKVKEVGFDSELMRRNPAYAAAKLALSANPEVEVVRFDEASGTITVRNKRSGKEVTMSFGNAASGQFSFSAEDENGKRSTLEVGGGAATAPSWVPVYPGAAAKGNLRVTGEDSANSGAGGNISYTTPDAAAKVIAYYQAKAKEMGMDASFNGASEGGMLTLKDAGDTRNLVVMVGREGSNTTIVLTYSQRE